MLNKEQKDQFNKLGILSLPSLLPNATIAESAARVYSICAKAGCFQDGEWRIPNSLTARKILKQVRKSNAFGNAMTPEILECIYDLVDGASIHQRTTRPNILFTLPHNIGSSSELDWHIDARKLTGIHLAGVQLFALIDSVKPGGGGPIAIVGSHKLDIPEKVNRVAVRKHLSNHKFFSSLFNKDPVNLQEVVGSTALINGIDLKVIELTGEPGDVFLMDLWLLHTGWPNAGDKARIMLTQRFLLQEAYEQLGIRVG